ncbi:MAG: hypothetical protein A2Y10_18030 [Planctomycetes bacterium GWF2_41_51]|nr:MAG: hypothetical protein A2Y10_18030 [Planctomycetes bacterium GWF2_41_51]
MKVKTITLEGETGFTAKITRNNPTEGLECILCELKDKNGHRVSVHHVSKNDREDQFSMAQCIQYHLDGCRGTNSMIHSYFRYIIFFAD